MEFRRDFYTRRHIAEFLVLALFSFIVLDPLDLSLGALYSGATPEAIRQSVLGLGGFAPLGMILLEALQVIIAPVPPVTMVASGYTFGFLHGSVYSFIGMTLGSATVILFSRKYGKPAVDSLISDAHMERFHHLTEGHGYFVLGALFVAPGFPHDILCYVAGLTDLEFRKLIAAVSLSRIPVLLGLVLAGDSIASSRIQVAVFILAAFALIGLFTVENEEKLMSYARKFRNSLRST
jgi:uncharacterized membrane protein YdjX (TVP38/TMEM64 family)